MISKKIIIVFLFLFLPLKVSGTDWEINEIFKNLRCLVCQGQSIADSNSDFASTIKLVVQDQIKEGKTKEEIYEFLISKYGEWIVYQPTLNKRNFLLWFLPYLVFLVGGLIVFFVIRKSKHSKVN
tara:strand:- start:164 stop:538 length:375 start_codon:yes stop_codon:yes gene_type:complete